MKKGSDLRVEEWVMGPMIDERSLFTVSLFVENYESWEIKNSMKFWISNIYFEKIPFASSSSS